MFKVRMERKAHKMERKSRRSKIAKSHDEIRVKRTSTSARAGWRKSHQNLAGRQQEIPAPRLSEISEGRSKRGQSGGEKSTEASTRATDSPSSVSRNGAAAQNPRDRVSSSPGKVSAGRDGADTSSTRKLRPSAPKQTAPDSVRGRPSRGKSTSSLTDGDISESGHRTGVPAAKRAPARHRRSVGVLMASNFRMTGAGEPQSDAVRDGGEVKGIEAKGGKTSEWGKGRPTDAFSAAETPARDTATARPRAGTGALFKQDYMQQAYRSPSGSGAGYGIHRRKRVALLEGRVESLEQDLTELANIARRRDIAEARNEVARLWDSKAREYKREQGQINVILNDIKDLKSERRKMENDMRDMERKLRTFQNQVREMKETVSALESERSWTQGVRADAGRASDGCLQKAFSFFQHNFSQGLYTIAPLFIALVGTFYSAIQVALRPFLPGNSGSSSLPGKGGVSTKVDDKEQPPVRTFSSEKLPTPPEKQTSSDLTASDVFSRQTSATTPLRSVRSSRRTPEQWTS